MQRSPKILEVLFPPARAEILRLLFTAPKTQRYVRELVAVSGLALGSVQQELTKLSAVGLVTSWSNGYHHFYRANRDHPLFLEMLRIVQASERLPRVKSLAPRQPQRPRRSSRRRRQKG